MPHVIHITEIPTTPQEVVIALDRVVDRWIADHRLHQEGVDEDCWALHAAVWCVAQGNPESLLRFRGQSLPAQELVTVYDLGRWVLRRAMARWN